MSHTKSKDDDMKKRNKKEERVSRENPSPEEKGTVEMSKGEYEQLRKRAEERDDFYTRWLKTHAEYENTRKRLEKEKSEHMKYANEALVFELFPIVDNFDMALASMEKARDKSAVMQGIRMVQKEFHKVLEENGVEKIDPVGGEFDPNLHEAVSIRYSDGEEDDMVVEEVRPGYLLNGRLLRPAQVVVSKKGPGSTAGEGDESEE
jgi:molecular chaperone GrpE